MIENTILKASLPRRYKSANKTRTNNTSSKIPPVLIIPQNFLLEIGQNKQTPERLKQSSIKCKKYPNKKPNPAETFNTMIKKEKNNPKSKL